MTHLKACRGVWCFKTVKPNRHEEGLLYTLTDKTSGVLQTISKTPTPKNKNDQCEIRPKTRVQVNIHGNGFPVTEVFSRNFRVVV